MKTDCPRCIERGKPPNFGSDPRCAFSSGFFSGENWNCATANCLRSIARGDEGIQGIRSVHFWADDYNGAMISTDEEIIHLGWYKNRGKTDGIFFGDGRPVTLDFAESLIQYCIKNGWSPSD